MERSYWTELKSATHLFVFGSAPKPWSISYAGGHLVLLSGQRREATEGPGRRCAVTGATAKDTDILDESLTFLSAKWVQWNP